MAPYRARRVYQRGHGWASSVAGMLYRKAIPFLKPVAKRMVKSGLRQGVGFLADRLRGRSARASAKRRLKTVALKTLGSVARVSGVAAPGRKGRAPSRRGRRGATTTKRGSGRPRRGRPAKNPAGRLF